MNIIFLTQVLPVPLDAGPKVREYYTLQYLSGKHTLTLLAFVRQTDTVDAVSHLRSICSRVETVPMPRSRFRDGLGFLKSMLSNRPFLITRDEVSQMDTAIQKIVNQEKFDAIHADQLWMAPYALKAKKNEIKKGYNPRIILDQHNAVYLIPQRMAKASPNRFIRIWLEREAKLMAAFEVRTCRQFDHVVWVTEEDYKAVSSIDKLSNNLTTRPFEHEPLKTKNSIIPICIDADGNQKINNVREAHDILFVGGMHWPPNSEGVIWFVNEVFPKIRTIHPQARFFAIGKQPPSTIIGFGNQVIAPGYVDNLESYWSNARVFVVPLSAGGGMRVKILDAWARGIPVVSTTIGAEGINYHPGADILIADTPDEFACAVTRVLKDDTLATNLSLAGKSTLKSNYDWRSIYPAWDKVYNW